MDLLHYLTLLLGYALVAQTRIATIGNAKYKAANAQDGEESFVSPQMKYLNMMRTVESLEDYIGTFQPEGILGVRKLDAPANKNIKKEFSLIKSDFDSAEAVMKTLENEIPQGDMDSYELVMQKRVVESPYQDEFTVLGVNLELKREKKEVVLMDALTDPGCKPRPIITPVPQPTDNSGQYYPTCVNTNKCGGCCQNPTYVQCVGAINETVDKQVFYYDYATEKATQKTIQLQQEKSCKCECRIKASDCVNRQVYNSKNCICDCPVTPAQRNCDATHYWSSRLCKCVCHKVRDDCPSKQEFDDKTCACVCKKRDVPCLQPGHTRDPNNCKCVNMPSRDAVILATTTDSKKGDTQNDKLYSTAAEDGQGYFDGMTDDAFWNSFNYKSENSHL